MNVTRLRAHARGHTQVCLVNREACQARCKTQPRCMLDEVVCIATAVCHANTALGVWLRPMASRGAPQQGCCLVTSGTATAHRIARSPQASAHQSILEAPRSCRRSWAACTAACSAAACSTNDGGNRVRSKVRTAQLSPSAWRLLRCCCRLRGGERPHTRHEAGALGGAVRGLRCSSVRACVSHASCCNAPRRAAPAPAPAVPPASSPPRPPAARPEHSGVSSSA